MSRRAFLIVLDSVGCGGAPDAEAFFNVGLPDTGGQVVFVLELAKQFRDLGYVVDVVTRRFENQPEFDDMGPDLRVWRIPFAGPEFVRKEDMHDHINEFAARFTDALRESQITYDFINSHYWDAGYSGQQIAEELGIAHIHTPHSLGSWKRDDMAGDSQAKPAHRHGRQRR